MSIELEMKEQVGNLLNNPMIVGLIQNKRYDIDPKTYIELEGNLNFSLSWLNDRLILDIQDVRPKITAKRFLKFSGRVSQISIGKDNIILVLDGLPDVTVTLT